MGGNRKPVQTKICPWAVALQDGKISQWLLTYGLVKRWNKWPPGRDDPQLLEAIIILANEESQIKPEYGQWHK